LKRDSTQIHTNPLKALSKSESPFDTPLLTTRIFHANGDPESTGWITNIVSHKSPKEQISMNRAVGKSRCPANELQVFHIFTCLERRPHT
jgi:hypothetical protein